MDARGANIQVYANQLLSMVILDTILDVIWIIFVAMILGGV